MGTDAARAGYVQSGICAWNIDSAGYEQIVPCMGHTLLADPWGRKLGELDEKEGMLISEIDLAAEEDIREQLPLLKHRRRDIYELVEK